MGVSVIDVQLTTANSLTASFLCIVCVFLDLLFHYVRHFCGCNVFCNAFELHNKLSLNASAFFYFAALPITKYWGSNN